MPSAETDPAAAEPVLRRYRLTVRARLALTYSALLTGAGIVMLALVYVFMRFVPTYEFAQSASTPAMTGESPEAIPAMPVPPGAADSSPAQVTTPATTLHIDSPEQMLNVLLIASAVVLLLLAVTGVAAGWIVAGRMLKPLQYINTAVRSAAAGDLGHRIGLVGPRDEISDLAMSFDDMLSQLERSFTASRRFAQNASHELRTPLATTRAMLDVAIARQEGPDAEILAKLRIMNERSIETVTALLDLASIESSTTQPEGIDLAAKARDALQSFSAEASARGTTIQQNLDTAEMAGDPVLIRQLVGNLVQNAIRHNNDDGFLSVATRTSAKGTAIIEVVNSGAQLDGATLAQLTEPFRKGAGRTAGQAARGHGLGLSIVAAITERHRGTLELEARKGGGLVARVEFPPVEAVDARNHTPAAWVGEPAAGVSLR